MLPFSDRLTRPLLADNPVTVQVLGLCSALAVSSSLRPAMIMAICVLAVMAFSSVSISLLRHIMPRNIRLVLEVTVIASAVIVVDEVLKVVAPDVSYVLSVFVGLIITNCIVLGRVEAFAMHNPVGPSFLDALGNGAGYALVLLLIASARELFGSGSLFGIGFLPDAYPRNELMQYAPSAFFLLGLVVWGGSTIQRRAAARRGAEAAPDVRAGR
jgi:Na+-transporting NADH:ubiquinone oxidoreductase subunit D